jgi:hypothetical protein
MNPDDILFNFGGRSSNESWDKGVWSTVVRHLVDQMAKTFGQPLQIVDDDVDFDEGFGVEFRTDGEAAAALTLRVRGIIGADVVEGVLLVHAWVFLYLQDARLDLEVPGEVLWMSYVETEQGGIWQHEGWEYGEPGEWDAFERFDDE